MRFPLAAAAFGLSLLSVGIPAVSAMQGDDAAATGVQSPYSYSDLADLAVAAPIVIRAQIKDSAEVKPERAPGLAPGHSRFYVEADIISLIRGSGPLAKRVSYLVDLPLDARGKPAKLKKKQPVLLFAQPVAASSGSASTSSIRLVAPDAQLAWDAATEAQLRAILTELVKPGAPPKITGIANGFHVPGTLSGEGETQLFLDTANGDPVSLTITTRADGSRRWAAAFGEIVEGAGIPKRNTLAWYRLACGLPKTLPLSKLAGTPAADRQKAASDYAAVLGALGDCARTRTPPPGV